MSNSNDFLNNILGIIEDPELVFYQETLNILKEGIKINVFNLKEDSFKIKEGEGLIEEMFHGVKGAIFSSFLTNRRDVIYFNNHSEIFYIGDYVRVRRESRFFFEITLLKESSWRSDGISLRGNKIIEVEKMIEDGVQRSIESLFKMDIFQFLKERVVQGYFHLYLSKEDLEFLKKMQSEKVIQSNQFDYVRSRFEEIKEKVLFLIKKDKDAFLSKGESGFKNTNDYYLIFDISRYERLSSLLENKVYEGTISLLKEESILLE